jgi:serine/threonine-protein kinase HipA
MDVWIEGRSTPVGHLERREDKSLHFSYAEDVAPEHRLSLSLPIGPEPVSDAGCRGYFANLLFEGPQLERVMDSYRLDRDDVGSLLWHLGADCPGAVSVTPEGTGPVKTPGRFPADYVLLDDERLQAIALSLHLHRRLPDAERNPSPVAGVQGKIAVVAHDGQLYVPAPESRAPTTHILKVSPVSDPEITRHEVALLCIAKACGTEVAEAKPRVIEASGRSIQTLVSTRFDRAHVQVKDEDLITRVHAEDFCQALGLPPSLKYERDALNPERSFSARAIARIAAQTSVPALVQRDILRHTLFNLLVGNTDNHGKNASLLHRRGGVVLAPLYDVVPVVMDRRVTHRFAFSHGGADFAEDFTVDRLRQLLFDLGFARPQMPRVLRDIRAMAATIAEHAPAIATKGLADMLHAQASVVAKALGQEFDLPVRDYVDRIERDEVGMGVGGWGGVS